MAKIIIDREKCKGCLLCANFCLKDLISADEDLNQAGIRPVKFSLNDKSRNCGGCGMCAVICPDCCITVYK